MKKLYINITNHCNLACPFCCMSSGPDKQRFMDFDTFYWIIRKEDEPCIVQLEGGEPLTHPLLTLFLELLACKPLVQKIVIDTNGFLINDRIDKIIEIAERNHKDIEIKFSYNKHLIDVWNKANNINKNSIFNQGNKGFINYLCNIISGCEFIDKISFGLNVRGYSENELSELMDTVPEKLKHICSIFLFNRYGRLENNTEVPELQINQVYDDWACYASDGTNFKQDLIARSKHENI